jgi:hypothetical protein
MERLCRVVAPFGLGIAKHAECDSIADVFLGAHAVDRLLHLAVPAVAAFHGVRSRGGSVALITAAHNPAIGRHN